jgi:hypothetical protein
MIGRARINGIEGFHLSNAQLSADVVPECGGKIVGLYSPCEGKNWLWKNPHIPLTLPVGNGRYVEEYDSGGIEEIFPVVTPSPYPFDPYKGRRLPDHGDVWDRGWEIKETGIDSSGSATLLLECFSDSLPCRLQRRITLPSDSHTLHFSYQLENLSDDPFSFLWAFHSVLDLEEGAELLFPENTVVRIDPESPKWPGPSGVQPWSAVKNYLRVPRFDSDKTLAAKLFTIGKIEGWVGWRHADGSELTIRFDPGEIPTVAIWANYGCWSGGGSEPYWNIGIEPMIGNCDTLTEATEDGNYCGVLGPRASREWNLELRVDP